MLDFFKSLFRPAPASGETAKERLRLVLLSDHLSLAPDVVESLKRDLLEVISRYVEIDFNNADVTFEQRDREVAMLANIPITAVRERPRPSGDLPFASTPPLQPLISEPFASEPKAPEVELPGPEIPERQEETAAQPVAQERPQTNVAAESDPAVEAQAEPAGASEPQLELATAAAPKPKPARSGNAAGSRRRRRKKYAAAENAKAKHSAPPQQLGGQASAQA